VTTQQQQPRSLRYEYELYVEQEIEGYKESLPRSQLLRIGDEAVSSLGSQSQLALTEVLLTAEVDRIIRQRLRMPSYRTWCRRRLRNLKDYQRPERWGIRPDDALVRAVPVAASGHALVAGVDAEGPAVFLAANGCTVTAIEPEEEVLERVMRSAVAVGIAGRVRGFVGDLAAWSPDRPLNAVICAAAAFAGLSDSERAELIALLQRATPRGGLHVLERRTDCEEPGWLDELHERYHGWQVQVERAGGDAATFLATKVS
jgi:hypothetical protein